MNLILLLIGLALLIFGAEIIIRGSISLGKKLKVSLFAIGVVIVAGGTSLPELASSINAVITNHSDLAVGAVIGSNIANLILVMAATSFLIPFFNAPFIKLCHHARARFMTGVQILRQAERLAEGRGRQMKQKKWQPAIQSQAAAHRCLYQSSKQRWLRAT